MSKLPAGRQVNFVIDLMLFVELQDRLFIELRSISKSRNRIRSEFDTGCCQNGVISNVLCRAIQLCEQTGRHREGFTRITESFARRGINGKRQRRPDVNAGQVTDRMVILRIREPAR